MASLKENDPEIQHVIERQNKEMEEWKHEADSVLVFAGLFSAVCAVSLVESYKWISTDLGDETVELLTQLVKVTQNIPLTHRSGEPFKRTFDIVAVNVIWFASITTCLFCAVYATLIQQWTGRYLALAEKGGTPDECARVREFLYRSLRRYQLPRIHQLLGIGLHFSIALYALGILLFIFHIDRNLVVFAVVGLSPIAFTYTMLTIFFFWHR